MSEILYLDWTDEEGVRPEPGMGDKMKVNGPDAKEQERRRRRREEEQSYQPSSVVPDTIVPSVDTGGSGSCGSSDFSGGGGSFDGGGASGSY